MTSDISRALRVEDVHKSYGAHEVLKGISLAARKGDVMSLIGSSGSGKSTFLRCINFLEIPDRGRFVVGGEEVLMRKGSDGRAHPANWRKVERIRAGLGMVFQSFSRQRAVDDEYDRATRHAGLLTRHALAPH